MIASHLPFQPIRTESRFLLTVLPPTLRKVRTEPQNWSVKSQKLTDEVTETLAELEKKVVSTILCPHSTGQRHSENNATKVEPKEKRKYSLLKIRL